MKMPKKRPFKVILSLELEVTNAQALMRHVRRLPNFSVEPGTPEEVMLDAIAEAVAIGVEAMPGILYAGSSVQRVEWFEHDHFLDKRHPAFVEQRKLRDSDLQLTASGRGTPVNTEPQ